MLAGMGHSHGTAVFLNICIPAKRHAVRYCRRLAFCSHNDFFTAVLASRKDKLQERYGIEGTVLRDGAANRMVGKEAVGGWIFLTGDRFCFVSHAINRTTGAWSVSYADIASVTEGKRVRSFAIRMKDGTEEEFIVNDRREWIGFLKEKCGM